MRFQLRSITIAVCLLVAFSACNSIPDHTRYIPKDAATVAGINLKSLSKKIAWNVITGSKLFQEMQKRMPDTSSKNAMNGLENAGIDVLNTLYVYVKNDARFEGGKITGIIPLSDAGKWEGYLKTSFPSAAIKATADRKEANLGGGLYAGWNKGLLIVISARLAYGNDMGATPVALITDTAGNPVSPVPAPVSETVLAAEMQQAFSVTKENSIVEDKRFNALAKDGHDVTFWVNYDQLITQYMKQGRGLSDMMGGFSLSNTIWKDAAIAGGLDFDKGRISGEMKYYISDELKSIGKELGADNADKEMIDRLPVQNLDALMAWHLSPKGMKDMLEKMGMLGLANIALASQNMNTDYIFDAFTGDMAVVLNDLSVTSQPWVDSIGSYSGSHYSYKTNMNALYVLKINKKENFTKLLQMAVDAGGLLPMGANAYYHHLNEKDSVFIMVKDNYAAISNKYASATGFLQNSFKGQKLPGDASAHVYGHPAAIYIDVQQMVKTIDPSITHSSHDSAMVAEAKKLLSDIHTEGGSFKDNAFEYKMALNFTNKDENSILELLDFGMRMNDAANAK